MTKKYRPRRKYLPIRAKGYSLYPDGKLLMGTFWANLPICDPLWRLVVKSNLRMRLHLTKPHTHSLTPALERMFKDFEEKANG